MKITKIHLTNLRNDAHFQFHTEFSDLVKKHNQETLKVKPLFDAYLPLYEREDEALKKINKSVYTEKIQEADRARDEIFAGMVEVNNGMCKHFSKNIAEAAQKVKIVLDTYGNVAKKTLNEETSAIYNLIQDLRSEKYGNETRDASLMTWVDELEKRNKAFEALMKERFDETAHKTDIVLRTARGELDKVYHAITERIDALVIVEGTEDYEEFVKTFNAVVAKYNVKHHHHKHSHERLNPDTQDLKDSQDAG
jgi:Na+/phosphate symporter